MTHKKYNKKGEKGFVILFAVLVAMVVVTITSSVSLVSFKELRLSSSARNGSIAFFAADSGLECALFSDKNGLFIDTNTSINCNNQNITLTIDTSPNPDFSFDLPLNGTSNCATVHVFKDYIDSEGISNTRIESFGHNTPCNNTKSLMKVERALRITYPN